MKFWLPIISLFIDVTILVAIVVFVLFQGSKPKLEEGRPYHNWSPILSHINSVNGELIRARVCKDKDCGYLEVYLPNRISDGKNEWFLTNPK